jgi:hypothetical protein
MLDFKELLSEMVFSDPTEHHDEDGKLVGKSRMFSNTFSQRLTSGGHRVIGTLDDEKGLKYGNILHNRGSGKYCVAVGSTNDPSKTPDGWKDTPDEAIHHFIKWQRNRGKKKKVQEDVPVMKTVLGKHSQE